MHKYKELKLWQKSIDLVSDKEFIQFLAFAHASPYELETQLIISKNLDYITFEDLSLLTDQIVELQKMNFTLQSKIKSKI